MCVWAPSAFAYAAGFNYTVYVSADDFIVSVGLSLGVTGCQAARGFIGAQRAARSHDELDRVGKPAATDTGCSS